MSNKLHKAVELTNYQYENIDFDSLKSMGYDTVIIEYGGGNTVLSDDSPYPYFQTHYNQAINAEFNIGFYFWVYSNVNPKLQAQEFYNLIEGKNSNCKFILDIELGSTENTSTGYQYGYYNNMSMDQIAQSIVENMKSIISQNGISNINDDDFVIYSSRAFAQNNLSKSIQKYNFWVADPIGEIPSINSTPTYNGSSFNWIGWQWKQDVSLSGVGTSCDLDVFKDNFYFESPIVLGKTNNGGSENLLKKEYIDGNLIKFKDSSMYIPIAINNTSDVFNLFNYNDVSVRCNYS